jgi:hypothetical protein
VLFVLSLVLVFFGTVAQIDSGVWTVVSRYFRSFFVWIPFQLSVQFGQVFFGLPKTLHVPGSFPFPGGWLLGALLLVNLLAAHAVRFRLSWKRSGIWLIHGGLVVMMLGELVTGLFAAEGNMVITEGSSSNYVQDIRRSELAVVWPSRAEQGKDEVVVVPGSMLTPGTTLHNELLPFDVRVNRYMANSVLQSRATDDPPPGDMKGAGLRRVAVEQGEMAGASASQEVEHPSAYVTFLDKSTGQVLGEYLLSAYLEGQPLTAGKTTYDVSLRFKRTYKPYTLYLHEFRFDRYPGTSKPKNYSSRVQLTDDRGEDREVLIRMNEPLRHRGDALFQSNFDKETEDTTVLQVVRNPGWLMPYVSCAVVSLGMLVHFGIHLVGFLRRRAAV